MKILALFSLLFVVLSSEGFAKDLYKYNGKGYSEKDFSPVLQQRLFDIEQEHYRHQKAFVDEAILDQHIQAEMKKSGKSRSAVEDKLFGAKEASDADIKKWYDENKKRLPPGYKLENIKGEIKRLLKEESKKKSREKVLAKLRKKGGLKLSFKEPTAPTLKIKTFGRPIRGNPKAKVTIIEFADYQCPHCQAASAEIKKLLKQFDGKINMVFMDFPINRSGVSKVVAEGSYCAEKQGKYWDYHDAAFKDQKALTKESPVSIAKKLKLDDGKFKKCLASKDAKKYVEKAKSEGERVGVSGTPSIYINGKRVTSYTYADLEKLVKSYL